MDGDGPRAEPRVWRERLGELRARPVRDGRLRSRRRQRGTAAAPPRPVSLRRRDPPAAATRFDFASPRRPTHCDHPFASPRRPALAAATRFAGRRGAVVERRGGRAAAMFCMQGWQSINATRCKNAQRPTVASSGLLMQFFFFDRSQGSAPTRATQSLSPIFRSASAEKPSRPPCAYLRAATAIAQRFCRCLRRRSAGVVLLATSSGERRRPSSMIFAASDCERRPLDETSKAPRRFLLGSPT